MTKNIDILDFTKFGMALLVVALHSRLFDPYLFPYLRLAVPVFFILTGFFTFTKLNLSENYIDKTKILKKIIFRYLKLYCFWFIVLLPYTLYIRGYFQNGFIVGVFAIIKNFLFSSTFNGSWYLMASIIGLWIVFLLSKKCSNKTLLLITIPIYLISTICSEFSVLIADVPILNNIYAIYYYFLFDPYFSFPIALLYLVLGKIIADHKRISDNKLNLNYLVIFFISLILLIIEYYLMSKKSYFIYNCDCFVMLAPAALFFVLSIININIKIKGAKILRNLSTIIYCLHMPMIVVISKIITITGLPNYMNISKFVITCTVCIIIGLFILKIEKNSKFNFLRYSH